MTFLNKKSILKTTIYTDTLKEKFQNLPLEKDTKHVSRGPIDAFSEFFGKDIQPLQYSTAIKVYSQGSPSPHVRSFEFGNTGNFFFFFFFLRNPESWAFVSDGSDKQLRPLLVLTDNSFPFIFKLSEATAQRFLLCKSAQISQNYAI